MTFFRFLAGLTLLATSLHVAANCCPHVCHPWVLRGRAVDISPNPSSDVLSQFGSASIDRMSTVIVPELDISYFFNQHFSSEFSLATSRHGVDVVGSTVLHDLGRTSLLIPSVTILYHGLPGCRIDPYFGAGINYTFFYDIDKGQTDRLSYSDSAGFLAQAGADFYISKCFLINVDIKKTYMESIVKVSDNGTHDRSCFRVHPWTFAIGVGFRF